MAYILQYSEVREATSSSLAPSWVALKPTNQKVGALKLNLNDFGSQDLTENHMLHSEFQEECDGGLRVLLRHALKAFLGWFPK